MDNILEFIHHHLQGNKIYGKAVVVGDTILDKYNHGVINRISPEAPVPIINITHTDYALGGAANVFLNLSKIGFDGKYFSIIGNDTAGKIVTDLIENQCGKNQGLIKTNSNTIVKERMICGTNQVYRADYENLVINEDSVKELIQKIKSYIRINQDIKFIIISDYNKGICSPYFCSEIIGYCNKVGINILVDPKTNEWEKYKGTNIITPNLMEFSRFMGQKNINNTDENIEKIILSNCKKISSITETLIVTRSDKGASCIGIQNQNKFFHTNILKDPNVIDVTGAGDTFISTLAGFHFGLGLPIKESLDYATFVSSVSVEHQGTSVYNKQIILKKLTLNFPLEEILYFKNSIKSRIALQEKLKSIIDFSKKIIFTNGCFDLMHSGHIELLKQAKNLGDYLIVGLNSDRSIKSIKGLERPIHAEEDRAKLLLALKYVDLVIIFDEDTPNNLIELIKPGVLVKGGDYNKGEIIGKDFADETVILPFLTGYSTTDIIEKVKNNFSLELPI